MIFILFVFVLCKIIADQGYVGESDLISTTNDLDSLEVKKFKNRVLSRQETFNSLMKNFNCLKTKWRHELDAHERAFKAICTLNYYEIKFETKHLFNVNPQMMCSCYR